MDRKGLTKKLNIENLEDYIISEFTLGKQDAELIFQEQYEKSIAEIAKTENDDIIVFKILSELIKVKSEFSDFNSNSFSSIVRDSKEYCFLEDKNESNEFHNLANYIWDYYDFKKSADFVVEFNLLKIIENSRKLHFINNYISKATSYFDLLNEKSKIDDFNWGWKTFDNGLTRVLMDNSLEMIEIKRKSKLEVERIEIKKNHEIEDVLYEKKEEIDSLKYEVKSLNSQLINEKEYFDKYYYKSQIILTQTYFGDNMPFLLNLYNFLKKNNLLIYGWSYFYSCMIIGNQEMLPLEKPKKNSFIGRIFYNLSDFLVLHYKQNPMQFIKSKFLINEINKTDSFKNNHMKPRNLKTDDPDPELDLVDEFFEKQKEIYLKM